MECMMLVVMLASLLVTSSFPVLRFQNCVFCWIEKLTVFEKYTMKKSLFMCIKRNDIFWGFARLLSHAQVVLLLRSHSFPIHDLPLKLFHVSQVFLQQLTNPHVIQAGWVRDEGGIVIVCTQGQSLMGVQVKGKSGWGGS